MLEVATPIFSPNLVQTPKACASKYCCNCLIRSGIIFFNFFNLLNLNHTKVIQIYVVPNPCHIGLNTIFLPIIAKKML